MLRITPILLVTLFLIASCGGTINQQQTDNDEIVDNNTVVDDICSDVDSAENSDNDRETVDDTTLPDEESDETIDATDFETSDEDEVSCIPDCSGRVCGNNGCGGSCAPGCNTTTEVCTLEGQCETKPECTIKSDCADKEWCNAEHCECQSGFIKSGSTCVAVASTPFEERTKDAVCAKYNSEYSDRAISTIPSTSSPTCDAGELGWDHIDDTVRRLNLYRWLVGIGPSYSIESYNSQSQEAAMMMDVNNSLSHSPPSSWLCYTSVGANAAGQSNLGLGYYTPSSTVDGYVIDTGNENTLGHRRWLLSPGLGKVGIGHSGRGNSMFVFGGGGANDIGNDPDFVTYPAAGYYPIEMTGGLWSITLIRGSFSGTPSATVVQLSNSASLANTVTRMPDNYGDTGTIAIKFNGAQPQAGEEYQVTINGVSLNGETSLSYVTKLVSCQ
ncbi:CAP domain-containing protein [bacterium]|nr:CAP domain-containing protein [bacterium]